MDCCGKQLVTAFCPQCGKANEAPIMGLLSHVIKTAGFYRCQSERIEEAQANDVGSVTDYGRRRAKSLRRAAEKWESWERALRELIVCAEQETVK